MWQKWLLICFCAGCEAFSRGGAIYPTEERSRRIPNQHESLWRARRRRRRGWRYRRRERRGWNHSHTQLPHHLLSFRPGEPTQQVGSPCHSSRRFGVEWTLNAVPSTPFYSELMAPAVLFHDNYRFCRWSLTLEEILPFPVALWQVWWPRFAPPKNNLLSSRPFFIFRITYLLNCL